MAAVVMSAVRPREARSDEAAVVDLLREIRAEQQAQRAVLDALVARLAPGPRDGADTHLVGIIAASTHGLAFTTGAAWRHRIVDSTLADAVAACDIENPKQLGKLLRRLEGRTVDGVQIVSVGMRRDGKVWRAEVA